MATDVFDHLAQVFSGGIGFRDKDADDVLTDDFIKLVAEKAQGIVVEETDPPLAIHAQNDAAGLFDQFTVPRLAFLQGLSAPFQLSGSLPHRRPQ